MKKLVAIVIAGAVMLFTTPAHAYEVKSGDTLSEIAQVHNMSLNELININPQIKNPHLIYVGQEVVTEGTNETTFDTATNYASDKSSKTTLSSYEIDLLARLVRAEAQGESFVGKVAVAEVVLNRVEASQFPDTISDVIYQRGQFSPVSNGSINKPADDDSVRAVHTAITGTNYSNGALFFYAPSLVNSPWLASRPTATTIGVHTFKY